MSEKFICGEWEKHTDPFAGIVSEWRSWREGDRFGIEMKSNLFLMPSPPTVENENGILRYVSK